MTAVGGSAPSSRAVRSSPSRARRAYSTTKNGLPSVRSASRRDCSSSGTTLATEPTTAATSPASRPVSSSRSTCRRARDSATSASAPVGSGWARQVETTSSRPDVTVSTSIRSTRRLATSAQCRSSSTSSTGSAAAASATRRVSPSRTRNSAPSSSSPPSSSSSPSCSSTCCHGQSAGAPPSWRAAADQHPATAGHDVGGELRGEPRLADARFPGQRGERRHAGLRAGPRLHEGAPAGGRGRPAARAAGSRQAPEPAPVTAGVPADRR